MQKLHGLPEIALIDMGDFVGGMLKYLRAHPVPRVTIAGGVGKMTKLAQGLLDLHSRRGSVDLGVLAELARAGRRLARAWRAHPGANTAAEAFAHAGAEGVPLGRCGRATADGRPPRASLPASPSRSRSPCSTATGGSSATRRSRPLTPRLP